MNTPQQLEILVQLFSDIEEVSALAVGGSMASGTDDEGSDFDIYVYSDAQVPVKKRREIAAIYAKEETVEINNTYWETGDEWTWKDGSVHIDIMYRSFDWIEAQINRLLVKNEASIGYSTCFWYNLLTSEILFDRDRRLSLLQTKAQVPYPEKLQKEIIRKNLPLLNMINSSYTSQIEKAIYRGDMLSVNHRLAAYFASYFDVLFALNKVAHPGEKRLMQYATDFCKKLPEYFEDDIQRILTLSQQAGDAGSYSSLLENCTTSLQKLCSAENLI
ncbi:MAG: nucleotidyltransferase domain-containing protein [Spirochaetia bacterium]